MAVALSKNTPEIELLCPLKKTLERSLPAVANCYSNSVLITISLSHTQFTRKFAAKKGGSAQSTAASENNKSNFARNDGTKYQIITKSGDSSWCAPSLSS